MDRELRAKRIGGSDVAPICGLDELGKTEFSVWYDKHRQPAEAPAAPNIRMVVGKAMEPGILTLYSQMTGKPIEYHDHTILDPDRRFMAATPDAFWTDRQRGVEAKYVMSDQAFAWDDGPPYRAMFQCWWYCAAFNLDAWDLVAMIGGREPRIFTVRRLDREAEDRLLLRMEEWHTRYILGDEIPPLGRSPDAARWLERMYPRHKRPDLRQADGHEAHLLNEYVEVRLAQRKLKHQQDEMETAIKAAIKDREGLQWSQGKFTWRKCKDSEEINWEAIARGLMHEYLKDNEPMQETLVGLHTRIVEGKRRIRIDHPALKKGALADGEETEAA